MSANRHPKVLAGFDPTPLPRPGRQPGRAWPGFAGGLARWRAFATVSARSLPFSRISADVHPKVLAGFDPFPRPFTGFDCRFRLLPGFADGLGPVADDRDGFHQIPAVFAHLHRLSPEGVGRFRPVSTTVFWFRLPC
jgi:hypothetical protein